MQCSLRLSQLIPGRASRRSHNRSSNPHPSGHSFSALAPGQEHSPTHVDSVHGRLQSRRSSPAVLQPVPVKHPGCLSIAAAVLLHTQVLCAGGVAAAELLEANISNEGNIPTELSAAGEQSGPSLSSLVSGTNKKQIEGCTRRCVPTCIRGGEGAPGLGPISLRKEIIVFKDGFRSRQYCLSECAQVCSFISNKASDTSSNNNSAGPQEQASTADQKQRSPIAAAAAVAP
eukprot:GHUV01015022.1.p1 GENE.GHUV01015022.1~~GHUV01015022.1.p1  ORF type:complete len:230 (+),score=60.61 GHUV01015022.1:222-911(+)